MEERQRSEKRMREGKHEEFTPRWFTITKDISPTPWGDLEIYEYNGKYTARRQAIDSANSGKEIDIEELKSIAYNPWQYESVEDSTLHEVQTLPISVEPASS